MQPLKDRRVSDANFPRQMRGRTAPFEVVMKHHAANGSGTPNAMQALLPPRRFAILHNDEMQETLPEALGRRLREARERASLTQKRAGDLLGVGGHSPVGQWERGVTLPSQLNLIFCAELYKVSLDWLVWGMRNDREERLKKLPPILRMPLIERIEKDIADAEQIVKRLPQQFGGDAVLDDDERLRLWSAEEKQRQLRDNQPPAAKKKPAPGTQ